MKPSTRFRIYWCVIWVLSLFALISGFVFITAPNISGFHRTFANLLAQLGGAFFFALTAGYIFERIRNAQGYSVLWLFSHEFRKAGVLAFYSDRKNNSEKALEEAFERQNEGEVLMAGASLRLFLASGHNFYYWTHKILNRKGISIRAISSNPDSNCELPIRSFIEEFNQDKSFPKDSTFDWKKERDFSFDEFVERFFKNHGTKAPPEEKLRVISDLEATRTGVRELKGVAKGAGNSIKHRESKSAPYCTVIIFPDRAFYTPNLLSSNVPANMPTLVFHRSSEIYEKLVEYFEFLWWVSDPEPKLRSKDV
jgi:hypothetical protein